MLVSFMVEFTVDIPDGEFVKDEELETPEDSAVIEYVQDNWLDLMDAAGDAHYYDVTMIG